MKRAILTFVAVLSLTGGIVGSAVVDARSSNAQQSIQKSDDKDHGKKCDDDERSKKSTPKACKDKEKDDHGNNGHHGDE